MEEAEALCSRIGIIVKGELQCVGSVQHLKNKYGSGYSLEIKVSGTNTENKNFIKNSVNDLFSDATIEEEFGDRIIFKIPQLSNLGLIFTTMETRKFCASTKFVLNIQYFFSISDKSNRKLEEYALSQTTLEQVFLRFAQRQEDDDDYDDELEGVEAKP